MEFQKDQKVLNYDNSFVDENFGRVSISNVQQINDMAYYFKGKRWIDSRLVNEESTIKPKKTIEFGSDEYMALAEKLATQNRQGSIALKGDILLMVDEDAILIRNSN